MQSFKGVVINFGRSGALQRHSSSAVPGKLLNSVNCNRTGSVLQHYLSTSSSSRQESGGFFNSIFGGEKVELQHAPHKEALTSTERIIEIQTHNVRPDLTDEYVRAHQNVVSFINSNQKGKGGLELNCASLGNFNVIVGFDTDQYLHIWCYDQGYSNLDSDLQSLRNSSEFNKLNKEVAKCLNNRHNQVLLPFSFWPDVYMRKENNHIYELRTYDLKPGTMVEWGNYWARAIKMRDFKHSEPFIGMFSQVGELYNVKHIWCYDSFNDRKEAREVVWKKQQMQWSEIIAGTMPLINHMTSRIMIPLDYSTTT